MPLVSIDIPAGQMARLIAAFVGTYNYQATVPDPANPGQIIANPETKPQFVQRMFREYAKETVKGWEATQAGQAARQAAAAKAETEIVIT